MAADSPEELAPQSGYPDPWMEIERRLFGLRLWMPADDPRLARMHRIVQAVVRARLDAGELPRRCQAIQRLALHRAKKLNQAQALGAFVWELEPLRDSALLGMSHNLAGAVRGANRIGNSLQIVGRLTDAGTVARAAVDCGRRLVGADPGNRGRQRDLSVSCSTIGDVQIAEGDLTAALGSYRAGLAVR